MSDYQTIQDMFNAAGPGGTVTIPPGSYTSDPNLTAWNVTDRTVLAYGVTFINGYLYTEGNTVWHGGKVVQQSPGFVSQVVAINGSNCTFRDLDFELEEAYVTYQVRSGADIRLQGGRIRKAPPGSAIGVTGGERITISDFTISGHEGGSDDTITFDGALPISNVAISNLAIDRSQALIRVNPLVTHPIRNISLTNVSGSRVSSIIRLSPEAAGLVENISVRGVNLNDQNGEFAYWLVRLDPTGTATIRNVSLSDIQFHGRMYQSAPSFYPVHIVQNSASLIEKVHISSVTWSDSEAEGYAPAVFLRYESTGGGICRDVRLDDLQFVGPWDRFFQLDAPIEGLRLGGAAWMTQITEQVARMAGLTAAS